MLKPKKSTTAQTHRGSKRWSAWLTETTPINLWQMSRMGLAAGLAILVTGYVGEQGLGQHGGPFLLASMGATAVILFAVPHSPMARPWAVIAGHLLSGAIGITCALVFADIRIAAAVAAGLSLLVMNLTRCLHPPGGATALLAVLGGESVRGLGYQFLLIPALNLVILLILARLANRQPAPQPTSVRPPLSRTDPPPMQRVGIRTEDWQAALHDFKALVDVSESELQGIYHLAVRHAHERQFGQLSCGDIMSKALITVEFGTELETVWQQMNDANLRAIPVVDRGRHVIGIVTRTDFLRHAEIKTYDGLRGQLTRLLRRTPGITSSKPEVAGQIMSSPVVTAHEDTTITELARLLSEQGIHQIPIVDQRNKLVGLMTQSDLIATLCRAQSSLIL